MRMKIKQSIVFDAVSAKMTTEMFLRSKRMRNLKKGVLIFSIGCVLLYLLTVILKKPFIFLMILSVFVLFTGYIMLPFYIRLLNAQEVVSLVGKKESYTINDKTIRITSTVQSGSYSWDECSDVIDSSGYIGVILNRRKVVLLKKSELSNEQVIWLLDK